MRTILAGMVALAGMVVLASGDARAQMPPETYQGSVGDRLKAEAVCLVQSFRDGGWTGKGLQPGEYRNPTTCAKEGRPYGWRPFG